ncbi:MAG: fused MFS/spermidine synthase [Cyanobacteria bacterium P01_H01_bin.121]
MTSTQSLKPAIAPTLATVNSNGSDSDRLDLDRRLQLMREQPSGLVAYNPTGNDFVMVEKVDHQLRLVLINQASLTSELIQSAIDLENPLQLVAQSHQVMTLGLLFADQPQRLYMVGFGAGVFPTILRQCFPDLAIESSEILPELVELAQTYFGVVLDEQLQVAIAEGRSYLEQQPATQKFDLILIDAFLSNGYVSFRLATQEFYRCCQTHLTPDGVVIVNLLANDPYLEAKVNTIQAAFHQVFWCELAVGNYVFFATNQTELDCAQLLVRAQAMQIQCPDPCAWVDWAAQLKVGAEFKCGQACTGSSEQAEVNSEILRDEQPPADYFETLPVFNTLFSKVREDSPCPCGSGQLFSSCHGKR